jgi:hypothetical protein
MSENKYSHLIPKRHEEWFKEEFTNLWDKGYTAKQIFKELKFNDSDMPWKLELWHCYYFARKYKLKKRCIHKPKVVRTEEDVNSGTKLKIKLKLPLFLEKNVKLTR